MSAMLTPETAFSQEKHLESLVRRRLTGRIRDLRVRVHAGGVVLQGRTATYHAKQLAQHAIMELCGLRILKNEIDVGRVQNSL